MHTEEYARDPANVPKKGFLRKSDTRMKIRDDASMNHRRSVIDSVLVLDILAAGVDGLYKVSMMQVNNRSMTLT